MYTYTTHNAFWDTISDERYADSKEHVFRVYANDCDFGIITALDAQDARDKAAQMAGYKDESDLVYQLESPSEIIAEAMGE